VGAAVNGRRVGTTVGVVNTTVDAADGLRVGTTVGAAVDGLRVGATVGAVDDGLLVGTTAPTVVPTSSPIIFNVTLKIIR